ncbi:hypothetical protein [Viridibacillus arvi]|uniref:hypothetical protein n=1 Tax=Viridibacillus arvi TaxID=263475 RepID=UPI0034CE9FAC
MAEQKLVLDADKKAVVEREIKSAYGALATLLEWVRNDSLTVEMKESLPNLVDLYLRNVKESIGFTGEESEREKEIKESIGQYYQKEIKELQQALANQNSIAGISATTKLAFEKIDKWWGIEGFDYIRKKSITEGGLIKLELGFMIDSLTSRYSKTPVSDKELLKTKVQYLEEKGFQFTPKKRGYRLDVIDNDNNRKLLQQIIKEAFPSSRIWKFENHMRRTNDEKDDYFVIRSVEITIVELSDIDRLEIQEKYFLIDEDDE